MTKRPVGLMKYFRFIVQQTRRSEHIPGDPDQILTDPGQRHFIGLMGK